MLLDNAQCHYKSMIGRIGNKLWKSLCVFGKPEVLAGRAIFDCFNPLRANFTKWSNTHTNNSSAICGKIQTRKTSLFGQFSRSVYCSVLIVFWLVIMYDMNICALELSWVTLNKLINKQTNKQIKKEYSLDHFSLSPSNRL